MGITSDDEVKQALLDSLAEEPPMVLSTAYVYAKNYVETGEDITKAWTTAVQQASVIQEVRQKAWVEAYDSFKKDYENRLKADLKAILVELQLEIEELNMHGSIQLQSYRQKTGRYRQGFERAQNLSTKIIQEKINALGGNENA